MGYKLPTNHEIDEDLRCPKRGTSLVARNGKYGNFYGCPNYPRCKYACSMDYESREMDYDDWLMSDVERDNA